MEAILKYKRRHPDGYGPDVVDVVCPACSTTRTLAYEGWDTIICSGCKCDLHRPDQTEEERELSLFPVTVNTMVGIMLRNVQAVHDILSEVSNDGPGIQLGALGYHADEIERAAQMLQEKATEMLPGIKPF